MKLIKLHTKNTTIVYKNALCSSATVLVLVFIVLSVMVPVLVVSLLSPYVGIAESRVLYEQPLLKFKHQFNFLGIVEQKSQDYDAQCSGEILVACSTNSKLNSQLQSFARNCEGHKYWSEDINDDGRIDHAYFQLTLDSLAGDLKYFDLMLFFEAQFQHKCDLAPPALLAQRITLPTAVHNGRLLLKAELQLKQYVEFMCPFPGSNAKTQFSDVKKLVGTGVNESTFDLQQFKMEKLLKQLKGHAAHFQLELQETYDYAGDDSPHLEIELQLHVIQVPARYHLSFWERLGPYWLYFVSLFFICFYIMNRFKDFLFGHHIIRAWEVIPWQKLY